MKLKLLFFSDELSREFATFCWCKWASWQSHSGVLQVLLHFKNQCESHYLQCSVFVCFCNIWRLCEEKYKYLIHDVSFFSLAILKIHISHLKFFKQITHFGVRSTHPKVPPLRNKNIRKIRTLERGIGCAVRYFMTYGWGNIEKTKHTR